MAIENSIFYQRNLQVEPKFSIKILPEGWRFFMKKNRKQRGKKKVAHPKTDSHSTNTKDTDKSSKDKQDGQDPQDDSDPQNLG